MRILDFDDSFGSESAPTQGSIAQNAYKVFANDAAFEADKGSAGANGDVYYNSASNLIRVFAGGAWTDLGPGTTTVPTGTVLDFAGPEGSLPAGYLICDGGLASRATFAALFAVIGVTYGVGDGATTFNLPDLRARVVVGKDDMGGGAVALMTLAQSGVDGITLGAIGGIETYSLTTAELASHSHTAGTTEAPHSHAATSGSFLVNISSGGDYTLGATGPALAVASTATSITGLSVNINSTGSNAPHQNTQPSMIMNKMIKT